MQSLRRWIATLLSSVVQNYRRLLRSPAGWLMTVATIGLALALPASLFTVLDNLERLGKGWSSQAGMSVFLHQDTNAEEAEALASSLRLRQAVSTVVIIDPEAALAEFKVHSDFAEALDALPENPLPFVLAVSFADAATAGEYSQALADELAQDSQVDMTRLDNTWLLRLQAILALLRKTVLVIGALLGLTVLLVVGNTVRLEIENRREEILIWKLVGATDAFVRRPFVVEGLLIGLAGGLIAWIVVQLALVAVAGTATDLIALYGSERTVNGPGIGGFIDLLSAGGLLGILGAWLAVAQRLRSIEPE